LLRRLRIGIIWIKFGIFSIYDKRIIKDKIEISKRICSNCGKEKDVPDGITCENDHFIYKNCVYAGISFMGFESALAICPFYKKPLK